MSYAIIRTGGKQFAVESGQTLRVPSITADAGASVEIETMLADGKAGAGKLKATVVAHGKDDKVIVFKKKRRKQYKRKQGHRQGFTEIKID
jgi:large subunit ribosomal protein L21